MKRLQRILAAYACAGAMGCGGNSATLELNVLVPPGDDPFVGADQVRLVLETLQTAADGSFTYTPTMSQLQAVSAGKFELKLDVNNPSMSDYVRLTLEALSGGNPVGRGRSPNFVLLAQSSALTVYVGKPGQVTATKESLINDGNIVGGRAELSAVALRGRAVVPRERSAGALIVGGVDASGKRQGSSLIYDPLTQQVVPLSQDSPKAVRAEAALVPTAGAEAGQQALLWGGSGAQGTPTPAELFDLAYSDGARWAAPSSEVADAKAPGAIGPTVAEVQDGIFLLTGGKDGSGGYLMQGVRAQRFPAPSGATTTTPRPGVQRIPATSMDMLQGPLLGARYRHSATPVTFKEGLGLLLFGGLAKGDAVAPVAERYVLDGAFSKLDLVPAVASRQGHVALPLWSGKVGEPRTRVLIAGGYEGGDPQLALDSGFVVDVLTGAITPVTKALSAPRQGASASEVGGEFVVCGGLDQDSKPVASCDVLSRESGAVVRTIPMRTPRVGHVAVLLETDQLLLLGGRGADGQPVAGIDIYTSSR